MLIEIIKDQNNNDIGWSITGETHEEKLKVNAIRNLVFFGFDDTRIEYAGRSNSRGTNDAGTLTWKQQKFINH